MRSGALEMDYALPPWRSIQIRLLAAIMPAKSTADSIYSLAKFVGFLVSYRR